MASPGSVARTVGSCKATGGRSEVKRLEPHGRVQGAIDLQGSVRSKPSQSGGTTRTEGVRRLAASDRRQQVLSGTGGWERTHRTWTAEGDLWTTPREAVWMGWLESEGCFGRQRGKASKEGRRTPVCVSEGGAKDRKVGEGAERCWTQLDWESREGPKLRFQGRGGMWERPTTRTWSW